MVTIDTKKGLMIGGAVVLLGLGYAWWSTPLVVTVQGTGEVKVPATTAAVSFQIAEANPSPVMAVTNLKSKAQVMRQLLLQNGVKNEDVTESQPQVVPAAMLVQNATGYMATMSLGGMTNNVSNVSQMAAALYEKGASMVSQPVLSVQDQTVFDQQALQKALQDAQKQAGNMASKNWKLFKKVAAITQTTQATGTVTNQVQAAAAEQTAQKPATTIPMSDNITIAKTVQVTYRMW
jgi:uncharacterized protein YggE